MQILEDTVFGLRSARISLVSPLSDTSITLFPMVHVGEPDFYRKVYEDARDHDVVLIEGVDSPITTRVTRSYRWMLGSKRLNLRLQPKFPQPSSEGLRVVHADLSADEFRVVWEEVPLWIRWLVYVAAPVIGLHRKMSASRRTLAKGLAMDDQPSQKELVDWSPEATALTGAILDARDARLIERLEGELDHPNGQARRIAIVYGAMHMRAVLRAVTTGRRRYHAKSAEWLTIWSGDQ
jgi:hypothetical protein